MEAESTAAHWNLRGQCPETLMEVGRKAVMAVIHTGSQVSASFVHFFMAIGNTIAIPSLLAKLQ